MKVALPRVKEEAGDLRGSNGLVSVKFPSHKKTINQIKSKTINLFGNTKSDISSNIGTLKCISNNS